MAFLFVATIVTWQIAMVLELFWLEEMNYVCYDSVMNFHLVLEFERSRDPRVNIKLEIHRVKTPMRTQTYLHEGPNPKLVIICSEGADLRHTLFFLDFAFGGPLIGTPRERAH